MWTKRIALVLIPVGILAAALLFFLLPGRSDLLWPGGSLGSPAQPGRAAGDGFDANQGTPVAEGAGTGGLPDRDPARDGATSKGEHTLQIRSRAGFVVLRGDPEEACPYPQAESWPGDLEAVLEAGGSPLYSTTGDARGFFELLLPGGHALVLVKTRCGVTLFHELAEFDEKDREELAIWEVVKVEGRVTDDRGAPLAGLKVFACPAWLHKGDWWSSRPLGSDVLPPSFPSALTGGDGTFSITGLSEDDYNVYALDPAGRLWSGSCPQGGYVELRLDGEGSLRIRAEGPEASERIHFPFTIEHFNGSAWVESHSGFRLEPGKRELDLVYEDCEPGSYRVFFRMPGCAPEILAVEVHSGEETLVLHAGKPGAALAGKVTDTAGDPVEGERVRLAPVEDPSHNGFFDDWTRTDAQGAFLFKNLPAWDFRVSAGGEQWIEESCLARPGAAEARLALRRRPRYSGRLVPESGRPLPRKLRVWARQGDLSDSEKYVVSAEGGFSFPFPGAFDPPARREKSVEVVLVVEGWAPVRAPSISLAAGLNAFLGDFSAPPSRVLSGMVLDKDDRPVAGARVSVHFLEGALDLGEASAGRDGSFQISEMPLWEGLLRARGPKPLLERRARLAASGPGPGIMRLPVGGFVSGRVTRLDGSRPEEMELVFQPLDSGEPLQGGGRWLTFRGLFETETLPPGRYRVSCPLGELDPVVTVREGEKTEVKLVPKPR